MLVRTIETHVAAGAVVVVAGEGRGCGDRSRGAEGV